MAGKAKSVYLTVCVKGNHKAVLTKMFFDAKGYNEFVKSTAFKEKYPSTEYEIIKEIY
jgi:hypothetical protein